MTPINFGVRALGYTGRSVSGGFLPTDIAGLLTWWDFSDIETLSQDNLGIVPVANDGDVIGYISDKSSEGNDLSQSVTSNKPLYRTSVQNGLSASQLSGNEDGLLSPSFTAPIVHWLFVAKMLSSAENLAAIVNDPTSFGRAIRRDGTNSRFRGIGNTDANDFSHADGDVRINNISTDVIQYNQFFNATFPRGSSSGGGASYAGITLGVSAPLTGRAWEGNICEVIGYSSEQTGSNLSDLLTYLERWA